MADIIETANAYFVAAGLTSTRVDRAIPHPTLPNAYFVHVPGYSGAAGPAAIMSTTAELASEYNNILIRDGDKWALRYVQ
jgi:hypothetical protein